MDVSGTGSFRQADCVRLRNDKLCCEILPYGATLRSLLVRDRAGREVDVVLGFDTLEAYVNHDGCFGATVAPVANRIGKAVCFLKGKPLRLTANDRGNCLHSGIAGLHRKIWTVTAVSEEAVTLSCTHPDGLGGIPGDIRFEVTYRLEGAGILIAYRANSDRDTLCNPTNHSYFNLDGQGSGSVLDHRICLHAKSLTPTDSLSIPTGAIRAVSGTALDLTRPTRIGDRIGADDPQLLLAGGFDQNFVVDPGEEAFRPAAEVWAARSGIKLTVYTDRPGIQLYTGNYIPADLPGKGGAVYGPRHGFCLETQGFPDAPNHSSFPSITLEAGREWASRTLYRFSCQ